MKATRSNIEGEIRHAGIALVHGEELLPSYWTVADAIGAGGSYLIRQPGEPPRRIPAGEVRRVTPKEFYGGLVVEDRKLAIAALTMARGFLVGAQATDTKTFEVVEQALQRLEGGSNVPGA